MRLELAGSISRPQPYAVIFTANGTFDPADYIDQGYTDFDVLCIGGGGGMGGGIDTANTGTLIRSYGGAGGGGGVHRVQGKLSALPAVCDVIVGAGGTLGTEDASNPAFTTDGGDGGTSSFNSTTCRASGGKGGKRVQTNSLTSATLADGGEGGIGDRTAAGGGAAGGVAGAPSPLLAGTNGEDGSYNGRIGIGGGGGAGGIGKYGSGGTTVLAATSGGKGSYNSADTSVYGLGGDPGDDPESGSLSIMPGYASGAKAAVFTGLPTEYGQSKGTRVASDPGFVILVVSVAP